MSNSDEYIKILRLPARIEQFDIILQWLDELCDRIKMRNEYKVKLKIVTEEIFVNISSYAYQPKTGDVEIFFRLVTDSEIEMRFVDCGVPYNPLLHSEPDINAGIEERESGGLGIFIVKNYVDTMEYEFTEHKNILTIRLNFIKNE